MSFSEWLAKQSEQNSAVGDLAREVEADPDAPDEDDGLRMYLLTRADEELVDSAWRRYQRRGGRR